MSKLEESGYRTFGIKEYKTLCKNCGTKISGMNLHNDLMNHSYAVTATEKYKLGFTLGSETVKVGTSNINQ